MMGQWYRERAVGQAEEFRPWCGDGALKGGGGEEDEFILDRLKGDPSTPFYRGFNCSFGGLSFSFKSPPRKK